MNAFVGEFLIISGAFKANMVIAAFSILGVVLGGTYMIWLYYRVALNEINPKTKSQLFDLDLREITTLIPLVVLVFFIGLQPGVLLSYMHVSVEHLLEHVNAENYEVYDSVSLFAQYLKEIIGWA
jgi:NADH-quinone oxidoreductase subunit M